MHRSLTRTYSSVPLASALGDRRGMSVTNPHTACRLTLRAETRCRGPNGHPTVRQANWPVRSSSHEEAAPYEDASVEEPDSSEYALSFLWLDKNLAVAVDQVFGRGHRSPITEYYWWPREDAWERLKQVLDEREEKSWMSTADKVKLLNTLTDVINYWSAEEKPSVRDAISQFPGSLFQG